MKRSTASREMHGVCLVERIPSQKPMRTLSDRSLSPSVSEVVQILEESQANTPRRRSMHVRAVRPWHFGARERHGISSARSRLLLPPCSPACDHLPPLPRPRPVFDWDSTHPI